jgi:hypothetical protein
LAVVAAAWVADPAVAWAAVAEAGSAAWAAAAATAAVVAAGDKRRAQSATINEPVKKNRSACFPFSGTPG